MAEASPFLSAILSPPAALSIGATLLSPEPDATPSFLQSMQAPVVPTPKIPSSACFSASQRKKKRQRSDVFLPLEEQKEEYQVVPAGKNFRLHPYVIRLVEEVVRKGAVDVLDEPLLPDTLESEPENKRRMRTHLRTRFCPLPENVGLLQYTRKMLAIWGGKLVLKSEASLNRLDGDNCLMQFVTPLRRPSAIKPDEKLEELEADVLMQLDFLDDEADLNEAMKNAATVDDNWTCGQPNSRRVTYHESPTEPAAESSKSQAPAASTEETKSEEQEPKAKRAKTTNPKRGMRWTTAERKLFLQGLERWGAGNWKSIHKNIPGRTYVQVKSMGVYLVSKFHMSRGQGPSKAVTDYLMANTTGS